MSPANASPSAQFTNLTQSQYVFRYGVLGWGIPTAFLYVLIRCLTENVELVQLIVTAVIAFPIAGIFVGRSLYRHQERKHANASMNPK